MKTKTLFETIATEMSCTPDEIMGQSRIQHVADARALVQYMLRQSGWSLQRIADVFQVNHASVMHNVAKVGQAQQIAAVLAKMTGIRPDENN
jgi:chromosomal replication initiation ATPase DnaA